MAFTSLTTDDFSGGLYSGRKAPGDTVYDCVNGLINDEGLVFRRGGSAYYSASDASEPPRWLTAAYFPGPATNRVLLASPNSVAALDGSLNPANVTDSLAETQMPFGQWSRPASVGDIAMFAVGPLAASSGRHCLFFYGGSLKADKYLAGTYTATEGDPVITGSGTSWLANVDPGMVLVLSPSITPITVKSVDSNTQITLTQGAPSTASGGTYALYNGGVAPLSTIPAISGRAFVAAAGSGSPRLLFCVGNRVYFSERGSVKLNADDYHELPGSATITGAEGMGDAAFIFTTRGVWRISNLSYDPIDAYGNVQHIVEQVNKDTILWDDYGITGFSSGLVLPCVDDVFIAGPDFSLTSITGRIRPLYRSYVQAGYQPGFAAVHRGHYVLPILNGPTLVDSLICRLDRNAAWTRWAGGAAGAAYAPLTAEATRSPRLLGVKGARVTDLTGCFDPTEANTTDADGTTSDFEVETRDYPTGGSQPGFVAKLRARYELEGAAILTPSASSDADGGTWVELTVRGEQNSDAGWVGSDGARYQWANVGRKRDRIRFKLTLSGASTRFVLRGLELLIRPSGRQ